MTRRITLKLATSLDGRIATASGESRWITCPEARQAVHQLRAEHQAVLVGVDTVIADDPALTVRLDDYSGGQPRRIVLDSRQRIPLSSTLVATAKTVPTILITTHPSNKRLTDAGVIVLQVGEWDGRVDLAAAMNALEGVGVETVLVEGGGQIATSFLSAGLIDAIEWFRAPILLGDEARPAIGGLDLRALADAPRLRRASVKEVGVDLWERYERS
ncbi:MAG TPA: bifunctional diaminohydroxyphosphoribosylaminopyrimidine deaminase/5-amino-6-(5-phosphoribosylamino)uracil reductase RibD [Caulobacteraceae bacterium]|jgi:diaminohydroxyphosphoribosylaminopyrimidine deaminase/5-amino-6-(5-phosphoribosylamino)uracil reductase|nr:bifunctional diaminohydroxyphosphoribosylaminopyrimidine deaminase/5-amino-6-(5-phosphoribosylamino)uracil reductase RibD [Caulobacteraceae bacterium]